MVEVKQAKSTEQKIEERKRPSNDFRTANTRGRTNENWSATTHYHGQQNMHGPGEGNAPVKGRDILSEYGPESPGSKARR